MSIEVKDLRLLKTDYGHKIKFVADRVSRLEKRVSFIEKLLWLIAGAAISSLVDFVLRRIA
jgi:hypothetical protein